MVVLLKRRDPVLGGSVFQGEGESCPLCVRWSLQLEWELVSVAHGVRRVVGLVPPTP